MISELIPEIKDLSPKQKLQLASELLDEVAGEASGDDFPLTTETMDALARSLADDRAHPGQGVPWEALRNRLRSSVRP